MTRRRAAGAGVVAAVVASVVASVVLLTSALPAAVTVAAQRAATGTATASSTTASSTTAASTTAASTTAASTNAASTSAIASTTDTAAVPGAHRVALSGLATARVPGVPRYPQYWFPQWNVSRIWSGGATGQGITVAVIDTGVQASVGDLQGSVLRGTDLTGLGGDGQTDRDRDRFDHGTAMAGLIAGHGGRYLAGVAPSSRILPVAVPLVGTNQGDYSPGYIANAIRYAAGHGAKIISMSLGGLRYEDEDPNACPSDTQSAIYYALSKGALVVAASGNSGLKDSPTEEPGVCLGVVSVAAVNVRNQAASFSSRHPYLTVAAPGVDIPTINANGSIYIGDGTSQATALTSGALALIWSAHPSETNRQIAARLVAGVRDRGSHGDDATFGYGTIDPARSIAAHLGAHAANPVFDRADPFLVRRGPGTAKRLTVPSRARTAAPAAYKAAAPADIALGWPTWSAAAVALAGLVGLLALLLTRRRRGPVPIAPWPLPPAPPAYLAATPVTAPPVAPPSATPPPPEPTPEPPPEL